MNNPQSNVIFHCSADIDISVTSDQLFDYLNNPDNLSSHMSKSSLMMMGSKMKIETDEKKGQQLGSEIRLTGRILGLDLLVKESVIELERPVKKIWQTQGDQKIIVIEQYKMGFTIKPKERSSHLEVFIDYTLPRSGINFILGRAFGHIYGKWCVQKMIQEAHEHFQ